MSNKHSGRITSGESLSNAEGVVPAPSASGWDEAIEAAAKVAGAAKKLCQTPVGQCVAEIIEEEILKLLSPSPPAEAKQPAIFPQLSAEQKAELVRVMGAFYQNEERVALAKWRTSLVESALTPHPHWETQSFKYYAAHFIVGSGLTTGDVYGNIKALAGLLKREYDLGVEHGLNSDDATATPLPDRLGDG